MRKSILIAVLLALGAAAWIASGQIGVSESDAEARVEKTSAPTEQVAPSVRVRQIAPSLKQRAIVVNGRAESSRRVELRAETNGAIATVGAAEGKGVTKGDIIARIAKEDREAQLAEARALLRQREMEFKAARELSQKGFRSSTKLAEAQVFLDSARALVRRMEIEVTRTAIRAPFDGILESRSVEIGAYVKQGDPIATVVDLDPVLIVASVSERDVGKIRAGEKGSAKLVDGKIVEGKLRFVGSVADPATRSFRVELEVPNKAGIVRDGVTAELILPLPPVEAFLISPALLSLSDDGNIGVKIVDDENLVRFVAVSIKSDSSEGVWITGLSGAPRIITVGQEFVKTGQKVVAVDDPPGPQS